MSKDLRSTLVATIWPGPIAGPLPINLLRILSPLLVFYLGPVSASLVMSVLVSVLSVAYFRLLELTSGRQTTEEMLKKLPKKAHENIETKGPIALFFTSILVGVFPYAIFLKLLRYSKTNSEGLLITSSIIGSFAWTGVFWGGAIAILRSLAGTIF